MIDTAMLMEDTGVNWKTPNTKKSIDIAKGQAMMIATVPVLIASRTWAWAGMYGKPVSNHARVGANEDMIRILDQSSICVS